MYLQTHPLPAFNILVSLDFSFTAPSISPSVVIHPTPECLLFKDLKLFLVPKLSNITSSRKNRITSDFFPLTEHFTALTRVVSWF